MKEKTILFPFDDKIGIAKKISKIENIVGRININEEGLNWPIPEVTIRCTQKQWKQIKFSLGLCKAYY